MNVARTWFRLWPAAWRRRSFRIRAACTVPFAAAVLTVLPQVLAWVERRPGAVIADPLLAVLPPVDLTWPIFAIIYLSLVVAIVALSREPDLLVLALGSYGVVGSLRMLSMFLLPLDPPATLIPLNDPFVQFFGTGEVLTRDLFFSGHTSTLCLLALTAGSRFLRLLFTICAVAVAVMITWHHAHYAIDVLMAPFVAYTSYRLIRLLTRRIDPESRLP